MKIALILVALAIAVGDARQQQRDNAPLPAPAGTAVVSGVVTTGPRGDTPVRSAAVMMSSVDRTYGDTAVTDEVGRFTFTAVPAGRYLIAAERNGYLRVRYGASKPGRPGTPVAVADGQRVTDLSLRLERGAAVTGRITDASGEPMDNVEISVLHGVTIGGQRKFESAFGSGDSRTDERGVYRLYGLAPGDYLVFATPSMNMHNEVSGMLPTTAADVRWARAQLAANPSATDAAPPARPMTGYAPLYYPGVTTRAAATVLTLAAGEERRGLDIVLARISTHRVTGTITRPSGGDVGSMPVFLVDMSGEVVGHEGVKEATGPKFSFEGVAPGVYVVGALDDQTHEWALADITVGGDMSVALTLEPGISASGRIVFQGTAPPPAGELSQMQMLLQPSGGGGFSVATRPVAPRPDGTFQVSGVLPGRYRLLVMPPRTPTFGPAGWTLRSASAGGDDLLDYPIEIRAGTRVSDVVVTFTDRPSSLRGKLQDASGRAGSDFFIIVFSADDRTWLSGARRTIQTRPASDGQFAIPRLPPGDYYVAALTDVEAGEWNDPRFLRELVPTALKVTIAEGERKTLDIRIAK